MEKGLRYTEALASVLKRGTVGRIDSALGSLALLDRSRKVRQLTDRAIRGIEVVPIPASLDGTRAAILVSNYPSVFQSLRAVIKVGCRISTERVRIRAVARPEIITEGNLLFKALGVGQFVFPVHKDQAGAYRLEGRLVKDILRWLEIRGNVLWLSITGRTRGNGLLEGDLRTGAALFSFKKGVPLVPMGLVTKEKKGRLRVIGVRFGEPICPLPTGELDDFERADYLIDLTTLAMCEVARLLPRGQRGDFEEAEQKLEETRRRLGIE
ncbi:MAG: hypothetical protein WCD51_00205 [Anaerolineae bacterium]